MKNNETKNYLESLNLNEMEVEGIKCYCISSNNVIYEEDNKIICAEINLKNNEALFKNVEGEITKKEIDNRVTITSLEPIENKLVTFNEGVVEFKHYEIILKEIEQLVERNKNLVVTQDTINYFTKLKARLNKISKALNDEKIAVKKEVLSFSYEEQEEKILHLKNKIDGLSNNFNVQLGEFSQVEKEKKKEEIESIFNTYLEENKEVDFITFEDIFNEKMLNKGTKIKKIEEELEESFKKWTSDVKLITLEEHGARIKKEYIKNGYDFAEAKIKVLKEVQEEIKEQAKIEAKKEHMGISENVNTAKIKEETKEELKKQEENQVQEETVKEMSVIVKLRGSKKDIGELLDIAKDKNISVDLGIKEIYELLKKHFDKVES